MKKNKDKFSFNYFFVSLLIFLTAVCTTFFIPNYFKILSWADYLNSTMVTELASDSETGSSSNPYIIKTAEQLASFAQSVNSGTTYLNRYIELGNNIDISSYTWVPIGSSNTRCFRGHFNGNGHAVIGLKYSSTSTSSFGGLFGYLYSADVSNVTIVNGSVSAYYAGALSGYAYEANIANCITISTTVSGIRYCGGIVGRVYDSTISQCKNNASVTCTRTGTTGGGYAGGIVGYCYAGNILSCLNNGSISCKQTNFDNSQVLYAGGINGRGGTVSESFNTGSVTAGNSSSTSSSYAGGITGYSGTIANCGNSGKICAYSEQQTTSTDISDSTAKLAFSYNENRYYASEKNWNVSNANILYTRANYAYAGGISGYTSIEPEYCYNIGSITGGQSEKYCTYTYVFFNYDEPLSPSLSNWFGTFEASKLYFSFIDKYYYSPINGNSNLSTTNCYGNASYDNDVKGNFSCYYDWKRWEDAYYTPTFYYKHTWGSPISFSTSSGTTVFESTGFLGPVDDAIQTHINVSKSGDTTTFKIMLRYYFVEYAGRSEPSGVEMYTTSPEEKTGYRTADLYTISYNNTVKFTSKADSDLKNLVGNGLSSTYWSTTSYINKGYPFPKNLLWSTNASQF